MHGLHHSRFDAAGACCRPAGVSGALRAACYVPHPFTSVNLHSRRVPATSTCGASSSSSPASQLQLPCPSSASTASTTSAAAGPRPLLQRRQGSLAIGRRQAVAVTAKAASVAGGGSTGGSGSEGGFGAFVQAFWKFLRPHTIRGTILGTTMVTSRALLEHPEAINWALLPRALLGLLALLCGNGYIVGINQIYDVDIDVVNKPFLPVASGELSPGLAWLLVVALAAGGVSIVASNFGPLITGLYSLGLFLGTVYSIPPLRLKQFAVPAFLIIATVRGFLLNFGVYYATRAALNISHFQWSPVITFITCFVTVFATVIAVTKDLPDTEGDRKANITTFATKMGVKFVARLGVGMLLLNYLGAIAAALRYPVHFNVPIMVGTHAVLALVLLFRAAKLDKEGYGRDSVNGFYRWIWNLFYAEYLLVPWL